MKSLRAAFPCLLLALLPAFDGRCGSALAQESTAPIEARESEAPPLLPPESMDQLRALQHTMKGQALDPAADDFNAISAKRKAVKLAATALTSSLIQQFDRTVAEAIAFAAQDYVMYLNAVSPRLTGRIIHVGPGGQFSTLEQAVASIQPGDVLMLAAGEFQMPDSRQALAGWNDVAVVGLGAQQTTLVIGPSGEITSANRLRLQSLRIECGDTEVADMRRGGTLHFRDCLITGYNSGAGGSSAIYSQDSVILVESTVFEGMPGRASRAASGGNAFDIRGTDWLYVRQSQFIDNREILRAGFPCCFDRCRALNSSVHGYGVMPHSSGLVMLRDSPLVSNNDLPKTTVFTFTTDDLEVIRHAMGEQTAIDERGKALVEALQLDRRLPYWIGLLRHENAEIRALAASRLSKLINAPVSASPVENRDDDGTLREGSAMMKAELEFARLMAWYEQNMPSLKWDDAAGRYATTGKK